MPGQLGLAAPKKITYFKLKGAAFVAMCVNEIAEADVEYQLYGWEDWQEAKKAGSHGSPSGQLPMMELADGTVILESGAISRACAGAAGLLGEGKDFLISEMLMGMDGDFGKKLFDGGVCPTMMNVKDYTPEKRAKFESENKVKIQAHLAVAEHYLKGDRFTEHGCLLGEIDFWNKLQQLVNGPMPEVKDGPFKAFYERMSAVPGIKKMIDGQGKCGALPNYVVPLPAP